MPEQSWFTAPLAHWPVWLVTVTLVMAAVIDGYKLKVPNWITAPFVLSGWIYSTVTGGWSGLGFSLLATMVGLLLLLIPYMIGGMGAGDVKLLAGVGAWMGLETTFYSFCVTAIVGGVIALAMVAVRRDWRKHKGQFFAIAYEIITIGKPTELSAIAAQRKSSMLLLPYGIPIAIGTIAYFVWAGMLI